MNRRESLKALSLTVSAGVLLDGCKPSAGPAGDNDETLKDVPGRERHELERDRQLKAETYFTPHEMATLTVLADIIIPKDERSGSASEAGVPGFIEFMVKDEPENQLPMRGGLRWLDVKCLNRYGAEFKSCTHQQQIEVVDQIAYPAQAKPDMLAGVAFFNKMRDLTAIGFFTSKAGIADLGYKGNSPNQWKGVPPEVLKQYGLEDV